MQHWSKTIGHFCSDLKAMPNFYSSPYEKNLACCNNSQKLEVVGEIVFHDVEMWNFGIMLRVALLCTYIGSQSLVVITFPSMTHTRHFTYISTHNVNVMVVNGGWLWTWRFKWKLSWDRNVLYPYFQCLRASVSMWSVYSVNTRSF